MADPLKILIIDDSEDDRLLYRRALQKSTELDGHLLEADDGERGLALIQKEEPACVLLDYSLPGRNGVEVLKRIRSLYPFLPVVMMTGQGNEAVAVNAIQEGAQNYIAKSTITPETLEHVIRMAIEHCMLQKRIHEQRTALEVFTRALAHDLKEPVRTIRSFVELIDRSEKFSEKTRNYFQHIETAADRMNMLIDTVFLYTRLDDPAQMAREICDTGKVLQAAQENIAELIREREAVIESGELPPVHVNRAQLMQLMQNLVSNAIQHSENPVAIRIQSEAKGEQWVFRVTDNGPGIDPAYAQKIFEPFKRLSHSEKPGAGLGLAICKRIVESHGGKIWCDSKPGQGATFLFTLAKALPATTEVATHAPAPVAVNGTAHLNGYSLANVLLVDDSRADIEVAKFRLIEEAGLQCNLSVARGGEEALAMLHNGHAIDLVLLDINMPEMDGFDLLEKIREDESLKRVAVVMCTGSIYDKDMERANALGAVGYLNKPLEFTKLKSVIDTTRTFQMRQENSHYLLLRSAA